MPTQVRWLYLSQCRQPLYLIGLHCSSILPSLSLKSGRNPVVFTYASIPNSKLVPPAWDQDSGEWPWNLDSDWLPVDYKGPPWVFFQDIKETKQLTFSSGVLFTTHPESLFLVGILRSIFYSFLEEIKTLTRLRRQAQGQTKFPRAVFWKLWKLDFGWTRNLINCTWGWVQTRRMSPLCAQTRCKHFFYCPAKLS